MEEKEKSSKKVEKTDKSLKVLVIILCSLLGFAIIAYLIAMSIVNLNFSKREHRTSEQTKVEEKEPTKEPEIKEPERTGKEITIYYAYTIKITAVSLI